MDRSSALDGEGGVGGVRSPGVTVRAARSYTEVVAAGELVKASYDARTRWAPAYREHLRDIGPRLSQSTVLVAVDESDRILGSVTFCLAGTPYAVAARDGEAELRMLALAADQPGGGTVEQQLVEECIRRATADGGQALVLTLLEPDGTPDRYYRRRGFHPVPTRTFEPFPGVVLTVHQLSLPTGPPPEIRSPGPFSRLIRRRG